MSTTATEPSAGESPRIDLQVSGMTCQNCVRHVREALERVPGVRSAVVSLPAHQASVRWENPEQVDVPALLHSLNEAGYPGREIEPTTAHHDHASHHSHGWAWNLWIGVIGTLLLMLGEWGFRLQNEVWFRWTAFAIATVVQIFAGGQFYRGAWNQLKIGSSNMDTLVALGSTTAYVYSALALFSGSAAHLYFMEAAAIISLISVGHWLEARVSSRASKSLEGLLNLAPKAARRIRSGVTEEVPVETLRIHDTVLLRAGDHVPTDGVVLEGNSAVNEAMLTGESMPVEKTIGAKIYAGTVNLTGQLTARVTATGEGTALANIISAVERAQTSRANIQRLADRVSSVFVPIVVIIALGVALFWGLAPDKAREVHAFIGPWLWPTHLPDGRLAAAFIIPAAVLIVACPCAMGLATPAAIMAASNAASRRGILIRDGVALEKAGVVTAVLFDKTGTLTVGAPQVAATHVLTSAQEQVDPLVMAASLASRSSHPLSQAIARYRSGSAPVPVSHLQEIRGAGVQGEFNGKPARLGSLRWLRENGVTVPEDHPFLKKWTDEGATTLGLSFGERLVCLFALKDAVKPNANQVMQELHAQKLRTFLITGDNARTAQSIARQAGIPSENVFSEVRPEEKAALVKQLQDQGQRVAFVGDGINDAPALEQADLGIAVSRASDVAREAADIILLNSEIEAVPHSLTLARATLTTIKQNLFWAFFYNALGIPLAALGFMSPILCAAAMGLSDIVVLGNALRLLRR